MPNEALTEQEINGIIEARERYTVEVKGKVWEANIKANIGKMLFTSRELWRDEPGGVGVLVGASPSLESNIDDLKRFKGKATIVAVEMAAGYLQSKGIEPDYVVCIDSSDKILKGLEGVNSAGLKLIADACVCPEFIDKWKGRIYWVANRHPGLPVDHLELSGLQCGLTPGGNVTAIGLSFLLSILNCSKVICCGLDFSFKGKKMYCGDNMDDLALDKFQSESGNFAVLKDLNGDNVMSSFSLLNFKNWHEVIAKKFPGVIVNSTEGGIFGINKSGEKIAEIEFLPLAQSFENYCNIQNI